MRKVRNRYMISWRYKDATGREHWVMERVGKLSSADIKRMEIEIGRMWNMPEPVIITNYVKIN